MDVRVQSLTIHCSIQHRGETWLTDDTSSHSTKSHFSQLFYNGNITFSPHKAQHVSEEQKEGSLNSRRGISVH